MEKETGKTSLRNLNSRVQHPVARVSTKFSLMSISTVRNSIHFHFLYLVFTSLHVSAHVEAIFRCGF
jgi:hypothetical protein